METATHVIGRQKWIFRCPATADPMAWRNRMTDLCTRVLPEKISVLLDSYTLPDVVRKIDRLEVQLSITEPAPTDEQLISGLLEAIEDSLQSEEAAHPSEIQNAAQAFSEVLLHYLEKGYLPWWNTQREDFGTALEQFRKEGWMKDTRLTLLLHNDNAARRFVRLLSDAAFEDWLSVSGNNFLQDYQKAGALLKHLPEQAPLPNRVALLSALKLAFVNTVSQTEKQGIAHLADTLRKDFSSLKREALFKALKETPEAEFLRKILDAQPHHFPEEDKTRQHELPDGESRIYISNSGLILIASFLPTFFDQLGCRKGETLINLPRILALLHYLVYGEESSDLTEPVLEKILCGIPLEVAIPEAEPLTLEDRQEADNLLRAVISHWSALKSTGPNGLRTAFLQRDGILQFQHGQWLLTVQKQTPDILLDQLPWNISYIKLPWMPRILSVRWNE